MNNLACRIQGYRSPDGHPGSEIFITGTTPEGAEFSAYSRVWYVLANTAHEQANQIAAFKRRVARWPELKW